MKKVMVLVFTACAAVSAFAQPSVGLSIGISQPGVYGRINIGPLPAPALVMPEPVMVAPPAVMVPRQPIYLYVPPEHQRDWRRYCGRYGACGQPVYFVQDSWVRERYAREHPDWDRHHEHGADRHDERDHGHDHGHDRGREHDHDHRD